MIDAVAHCAVAILTMRLTFMIRMVSPDAILPIL